MTSKITWSISFDREWVQERLDSGGTQRPRDDYEWRVLMERLQLALDNSTAGSALDAAMDGVFSTLGQRDYNVCLESADSKHVPEQHYDTEAPAGTVSVQCKVCGTSTTFPIPAELEWN